MADAWEPAWSNEVKIEGGGRFPLGLNRFHNSLEDMLIRSITYLANRLRYFTYCCWVIGDIKTHENCQEYSEFVEAFRRRENALAVGLYLIQPDHTVYGSESIAKWIKAAEQVQNCSFKLMQSVNIGAFELYYTGTLYNFGLTATTENWVTVLTDSGMKLYEIADLYYKNKTLHYYTRYKGHKEVLTEALKQWAEVNEFNKIKDPECRKERDFFKSVIFHLDSKQSEFRRDTFALFLESILVCDNHDTVFDEDRLRNIHYYSCFKDSQDNIINLSIPVYLEDVHFYWQIYEGHVYFRWWLNLLFQSFIQHLKECDDKGSNIEEFFALINPEEFDENISAFTGVQGDFYSGSIASILEIFTHPCRLEDNCSEEALTVKSEKQPISSKLARFTLIMVALFIKFESLRSDKRYQYVVEKQLGNLWFDMLYSINLEGITVREFLYKMLKTYTLKQHDQIMLEKRDLRKSWFTTVRDKYFFNSDVSLIWRPAKYSTVMHYLNDMNLINSSESSCHLTNEGKELYENLKVSYYL